MEFLEEVREGDCAWCQRQNCEGCGGPFAISDKHIYVKNLTPHAVNIILPNQTITIDPEPAPARCAVQRVRVGWVASIPVNRTEFGQVFDLPEPQAGTYYIVSAIVAQAMVGKRNDLLVVDDTVRDSKGQVVGAKALARI